MIFIGSVADDVNTHSDTPSYESTHSVTLLFASNFAYLPSELINTNSAPVSLSPVFESYLFTSSSYVNTTTLSSGVLSVVLLVPSVLTFGLFE